MRTLPLSVVLTAAFAFSAHAADLEAGRTKAGTVCAVCHGPTGLSMQPNVPHLAGQPAIYLTEQLQAYRSGKRTHEVMSVIARPLSDTEIEDVVQWYSSRNVRVEAD